MSVHIRPRVFCLAVLRQHIRSHLKQVADQLEQGVIGEVLLSEPSLADVAGVRLPQHSMTITGDNLEKLNDTGNDAGNDTGNEKELKG